MTMICEQSTPISFIRAECMDLWRDGYGGWSANCSWVRRRIIVVSNSWSKTKISRRIKKALGIQGMRNSGWAHCDFSWRDGCIGAYADWIV
jgi:hypothetical protein